MAGHVRVQVPPPRVYQCRRAHAMPTRSSPPRPQGYVIGLALLDSDGRALVGVMGVPPEDAAPPVMAAVRGHGLRWFNEVGDRPATYDPPRPRWADGGAEGKAGVDGAEGVAPPWLISPQKASGECVPFGAAGAGLRTICCGSMIKYFECAAGRVAGFVQYEETLKSWDHAVRNRPRNRPRGQPCGRRVTAVTAA